jgi:hypothetical protein
MKNYQGFVVKERRNQNWGLEDQLGVGGASRNMTHPVWMIISYDLKQIQGG